MTNVADTPKTLPTPDLETIATVLDAAYMGGVPVLLWGDPGIGKSSLMRAVADARQARAEIVIGSVREPGDFAGLPLRTEEGMVMMPPRWATDLRPDDLLGLDEITTAPPAVQAALLGVVLDRKVGDHELPDGVQIVAAANPPSMSGGWPLSAPLSNRFLHVMHCVDTEEWISGMLRGFQAPTSRALRGSKEAEREWTGRVAGFIKRQRNALMQLPKQTAEASKAWPSPRTWEMVTKVAPHLRPDDKEALIAVVHGLVGPEKGSQFLKWLEESDLPETETVVSDPASVAWGTLRQDQVFAILAGVVAWAQGQQTKSAWLQAWRPFVIASDTQPSLVASAVQDLIRIRPQGTAIPRSARAFGKILEDAGLIRVQQ